jgi:hypothetical protein
MMAGNCNTHCVDLKRIRCFSSETSSEAIGCETGGEMELNEGSDFECRWGQEFLLLHVVQIGSGVHPTSYPMCTGGSFPGGKAAVA